MSNNHPRRLNPLGSSSPVQGARYINGLDTIPHKSSSPSPSFSSIPLGSSPKFASNCPGPGPVRRQQSEPLGFDSAGHASYNRSNPTTSSSGGGGSCQKDELKKKHIAAVHQRISEMIGSRRATEEDSSIRRRGRSPAGSTTSSSSTADCGSSASFSRGHSCYLPPTGYGRSGPGPGPGPATGSGISPRGFPPGFGRPSPQSSLFHPPTSTRSLSFGGESTIEQVRAHGSRSSHHHNHHHLVSREASSGIGGGNFYRDNSSSSASSSSGGGGGGGGSTSSSASSVSSNSSGNARHSGGSGRRVQVGNTSRTFFPDEAAMAATAVASFSSSPHQTQLYCGGSAVSISPGSSDGTTGADGCGNNPAAPAPPGYHNPSPSASSCSSTSSTYGSYPGASHISQAAFTPAAVASPRLTPLLSQGSNVPSLLQSTTSSTSTNDSKSPRNPFAYHQQQGFTDTIDDSPQLIQLDSSQEALLRPALERSPLDTTYRELNWNQGEPAEVNMNESLYVRRSRSKGLLKRGLSAGVIEEEGEGASKTRISPQGKDGGKSVARKNDKVLAKKLEEAAKAVKSGDSGNFVFGLWAKKRGAQGGGGAGNQHLNDVIDEGASDDEQTMQGGGKMQQSLDTKIGGEEDTYDRQDGRFGGKPASLQEPSTVKSVTRSALEDSQLINNPPNTRWCQSIVRGASERRRGACRNGGNLELKGYVYDGSLSMSGSLGSSGVCDTVDEEAEEEDEEVERTIDWKKGEQIGKGTFGSVFVGLNSRTGEMFAVKEILLVDGSEAEVARLEREITLMKKLHHPNIVRYLDTARTSQSLFIFMEYVPGGSISSMLTQFGAFGEDLISRLVAQIVLGIDYLHSMGIIHRDVKGANVLVTNSGKAKLADFGCSKQLHTLQSNSLEDSLKTITGSVPWMAPEVIKQSSRIPKACDIWSIGATVIEMATARHPWPEFSNQLAALFHVATSKEPPPFPSSLSPVAKDFLRRCLVVEEKDRATSSELLQHPFISNSAYLNEGEGASQAEKSAADALEAASAHLSDMDIGKQSSGSSMSIGSDVTTTATFSSTSSLNDRRLISPVASDDPNKAKCSGVTSGKCSSDGILSTSFSPEKDAACGQAADVQCSSLTTTSNLQEQHQPYQSAAVENASSSPLQ